MLNYADALREIANAREEIPGRRGYPGYLYTDLATIFERTGRIKDLMGSITQIPIITLPNNDITHPVPDLTGYITEGQIVLSQNLHYKSINPPIDVLPSLSRLMQAGIGEGHTRYDHKYLYNQLYTSYAEGRKLKSISAITGEESLSKTEKLYIKFSDIFEKHFINCVKPLPFKDTLDLGWKLICLFPKNLLIKIPEKILVKFYKETSWSEFENASENE
jgi:V/A-type H+-transporting ATPase subunit B